MTFLDSLHRVTRRENLSAEEAREVMRAVLSGEVTTPQIAAFLVAMKMKGETAEEVEGLARAMRGKAAPVDVSGVEGPLIDTCGTGGDGGGTFNISTVVAFVVAGAGVRVAKHGNRSLASQSGSADVLEALGVNVMLGPEVVARAIEEIGFGFLFAPMIHPAMKHAQPARAELKMRTVFNLLGPLTNPAGATVQLVGAPSMQAAELMAGALARLGLQRGFVVHGADGLDEITTTGATTVWEVRGGEVSGGEVRKFEVTPEDFGVGRARKEDLAGGSKEENAAIALRVLRGEKGPHRDVVLVNAAAALVVAGKVEGFVEGMRVAGEAVDEGAGMRVLEKYRRVGG